MTHRRLGIDVGGTKCHGVVLADDGEVVGEHRVPTPHGADAIVDALAGVASELGPFDSIGVGVPGLVTRAGVVRASPNLVDVVDFDVARRLSDRLGVAVEVDNDATCAAAAEWVIGAGRGVDDMVMVTLGTGIGGGIVAAGRLVRGVNGFAGEIGHMVLEPDGPECPCGRRGCWERYASGSGLAHLARVAILAGRGDRVLELAAGDLASVRGEHVQAAAREGDPGALEVVDQFGRWVAIGLANLTNLLDPGMLVLGGGLATAADLYLPPIERWFAASLYSADLRPRPAVRFALLGPRAGAIGAALLPELR